MSGTPDPSIEPSPLPVKRAVSFAVHEPGNDAPPRVLAVLRPPDDEELPGVWGLPATSLRAHEDWEAALRRAGRDKLGIALDPAGVISEGTQDRREGKEPYRLHMRVFEATIRTGTPSVDAARGTGTRYADWRWADPGELREAATRGSLCTRLYLAERSSPP